MVRDIYPGRPDGRPDLFTLVGTQMFFTADSSVSVELWVTDGSSNGTRLVKNIRGRHPRGGYEQPSSPQDLMEVNGALFFNATDIDREDGVEARGRGRELWRSDSISPGWTG